MIWYSLILYIYVVTQGIGVLFSFGAITPPLQFCINGVTIIIVQSGLVDSRKDVNKRISRPFLLKYQ